MKIETLPIEDVKANPCNPRSIIDRMLKLDPALTIKKNGKPYKTGT